MAELTSLGVHTPVALPYLIAEGLLPEEASQELYQWKTYVFNKGNGDSEEEILATKACVVWSQGTFIRNVYRFDLEGEDVVQAILTRFPTAANLQPNTDGHLKPANNASVSAKSQGAFGKLSGSSPGNAGRNSYEEGERNESLSDRALVVLLKSKAHVYFLHGSSHIVDLPFEVSAAFPAPRGVVLQRKTMSSPTLPETPLIPAAPPNSFFSSQIQPSSSYLQSPTIAKSFGSNQPGKPSPLRGKTGLDAFLHDPFGSKDEGNEEDLASLYSLTSPYSDFGIVSYSIQHVKPRLSSKAQSGLSVDFEPLDGSEIVVYVSSEDELAQSQHDDSGPLTLIVTANKHMHTITVWHAWYIDEKSLASLLKQRAAHKAAKARRRSSFMNASIATGTTTPAVRHREGTRESFAGAASVRLQGETAPPHPTATSSRKPKREKEEEAMASQMDPDYQPTASQQAARESRRISSLNADVRASQHTVGASLGGTGGRRNASFGGPNERRSFGHRKSRGSTPGSILGRSLGPDDDLMDVDSSMDADDDETIDGILRHIRATFEAAGAESIFGGADEGLKRELVVRKLHSFQMSGSNVSLEQNASDIRVVTLSDTHQVEKDNRHGLNVYICGRQTEDVVRVQLRIKQRPLWPEVPTSQHVAIPIVTGEPNLGQCADIVKLTDRGINAIRLGDRGLVYTLDDNIRIPIPDSRSHKTDQPLSISNAPTDRNAIEFVNAGADGQYDQLESEGLHRRMQMRLCPNDSTVDQLLEVCEIVMPVQQAQLVRGIWCLAHALLIRDPERLSGTAENREWVALVTTVFVFILSLLDESVRETIDSKKAVPSETSGGISSQRGKSEQRIRRTSRACWSWMDGQRSLSVGNDAIPDESHLHEPRKDQLVFVAARLAMHLSRSEMPSATANKVSDLTPSQAQQLLLGLHVFFEEQKLCTLSPQRQMGDSLAALIAQLGALVGLVAWSYDFGSYYSLEGANERRWSFLKSTICHPPQMLLMDEPVGVFQWFEHAVNVQSTERYPTLDVIATLDADKPLTKELQNMAYNLTPRIAKLSDALAATRGLSTLAPATVQLMAEHGITSEIMETLPEAITAPFREAISSCEREPPTTWSRNLLHLVGREDLISGKDAHSFSMSRTTTNSGGTPKDVQTVCHALDHHSHSARTKEASRHAVSQLIFSEDRRLVEATSLMHFNSAQVADCPKQPDWSDAQHFEQQRKVMQWVTLRMIALPAGDAMIHFDSQTLLLTDKYYLPGFSNSCLLQPMGHTLTTDRSGLTEEKVNWAYFHAGVSAGLRISRNMTGIDTSWIAFNKPNDLTNRHAGLLLALGLNGHLRHLAKWLSFKYLTPKHTMTSVGLLLGLSASYMGTMDGLITRMLSVHITRMLPPGAAELNVSPITQTAGLVGIGLLYYDTQHRRMSEIMLSEVEAMELEDPDSGPDPLRDESYRLAAGFALGYINLGKRKDLRGLHGLYLTERLLAVAVGPRPVSAVHVFDRATAGAVVAIALMYMKSGDQAVARKIDIPDTEAQFDHVRPDMLMLRTMTKHIILWDSIEVNDSLNTTLVWTQANLPKCYQSRFQAISSPAGRHPLKSSDVPFFNIVTGLAWALSLKYAGSGNMKAREEILTILDYFYMVKGGADAYYYDAKLARSTVRSCIDVLAVAAATVMAGSGDLRTFRYLRRLHGRTDAETPYGSHFAAHLAIGVLFLGGGTFTFGTSDLAIASLICAFYPLYPTDVHDNHVHLQAFRHFWVFAAEARCLVVEEVDTHRPISMPIIVTAKDGSTKPFTAPCLLPELDTIASVQTNDPAYWRVTLDFLNNPDHLSAFRRNQRIFVRRCPASEAHNSVFSATLAAMNDAQFTQMSSQQIWQSVFDLPVFTELDKADIELIIPPDVHSSIYTDERGTVVDDRLVLAAAVDSREKNALWNLRVLFAWAERAQNEGQGKLRWIGAEVVEALKAKIDERMRQT